MIVGVVYKRKLKCFFDKKKVTHKDMLILSGPR